MQHTTDISANATKQSSFLSKHDGNYTFAHTLYGLEQCCVSVTSSPIFVRCSTTDHTWPRGTPVMRFSAKCAFFICLGIRKSTEHNFESEKKLFVRDREAPEAPTLRQQRVNAFVLGELLNSLTLRNYNHRSIVGVKSISISWTVKAWITIVIDERTDRWTDGRTDGQTDRMTFSNIAL